MVSQSQQKQTDQELGPQHHYHGLPPIVHADSRGGRVCVSLLYPVGKGYAAYLLNSRVHMVSQLQLAGRDV